MKQYKGLKNKPLDHIITSLLCRGWGGIKSNYLVLIERESHSTHYIESGEVMRMATVRGWKSNSMQHCTDQMRMFVIVSKSEASMEYDSILGMFLIPLEWADEWGPIIQILSYFHFLGPNGNVSNLRQFAQ